MRNHVRENSPLPFSLSAHGTRIVLIDLPTFPKGVMSLSLATVADCFGQLDTQNQLQVIDLNLIAPKKREKALLAAEADIYGLKVSSQSLAYATQISQTLRAKFPKALIIWGGEFPTLLPEEASKHAHVVFRGAFEDSALSFWSDYKSQSLRPVYELVPGAHALAPAARMDLVDQRQYWHFMGHPYELIKGCVHKCTFCMVHVMQPEIKNSSAGALSFPVSANFLNVVDYNVAIDKQRLFDFCAAMEHQKKKFGWMGEMCLESLADEEILSALERSRMRIVYCGLESTAEAGLRSVNKTQNHVTHYRDLIAGAQRRGIEVGGGLIIGLQGTTEESLLATISEFEELGLIYLKITFLTFNPGTKVKESMRRKGSYTSEDPSHFDGLRPTFLFHDQEIADQFQQTQMAIRRFYSWHSLLKRSAHLRGKLFRRIHFIAFSYCYGNAYRQWLKYGVLSRDHGRMNEMVEKKFRRGIRAGFADWIVKISRTFATIALLSIFSGSLLAAELPVWADPHQSREAQLKSCATCHQGVYNAWAEGPHSQFAVFPDRKKKFMVPESFCLRCHNSGNVMDTAAGLNLSNPPLEQLHKLWMKLPKDPTPRATGTDCITCHVSGTKVFAGPNFKPSPPGSKPGMKSSDFCQPAPSTVLGPTYSCVFCHLEATEGYAAYLKADKTGKPQSCIGCHADAKGAGKNHFFYWGNDWEVPSRHSARLKNNNVFKNIEIKKKTDDGKNFITVSWKNELAAHALFTDSPKQYFFTISAQLPNKKKYDLPVLRLKSPLPRHDPMQVSANNQGVVFSLQFQGEFFQAFELPAGMAMPKTAELTAYYKPHFEILDKDAKKIYTKKYSL